MEEKKDISAHKGSAFNEAIRKLKNHPFLLYSVAGLFALICSLPFDKNKIDSFVYLIYFVVGVPIIMQFYIEILKINTQRRQAEKLSSEPGVELLSTSASIWGKVSGFFDSLFNFAVGIIFVAIIVSVMVRCDQQIEDKPADNTSQQSQSYNKDTPEK